MRLSTLLLPVIASLLAPAQSQPSAATPTDFRSIELRGGGIVTVRHGATRRVRVSGENSGRPIRSDGDELVIERCSRHCPRGHRIEVEIVTPEIARLAVTDGGLIRLVGDFPPQAAVAASVSSGLGGESSPTGRMRPPSLTASPPISGVTISTWIRWPRRQ